MTGAANELLQRLKKHRALSVAPEAELEWFAERATVEIGEVGHVFVHHGQTVGRMWALLSGRVAFYTPRGSGRGKIIEWFPGDIAGVLPFSRLGAAPGDAIVEEPCEMATLDVEHFPEMIRVAPGITGACVHAMLDRARHFTKEWFQDEKLISLGRLSAGLSHELNNPASAAARSAKLLQSTITAAFEAAQALGAAGLNETQLQLVARVQAECLGEKTRMWSALDFSDREDVFDTWLTGHGLDTELTAPLAETALTTSDLDELATMLSPEQLGAAVRWIASEHGIRNLTKELERAAERIHQLVASVKRYSYMGRDTGAEPVSVVPGLEDTITVLAFKARARKATVRTEFASDLPPVLAFGGELNQVWHNLIDNALDAISEGGTVTVRACPHRERVAVEVADDGCGISPDIKDRVFDPFFTTKDVGEGSGLGLDIVRRILVRHNGEVEIESEPGSTVFRVLLPVAASAAVSTLAAG
jgi:signal transduction histidine kinase